MAIILHLGTTNDTNGNPRRIFVALDGSANIVGVADEGYEGREAARRLPGYPNVSARFEITPGQYRDLVRRARGTASMMSGQAKRKPRLTALQREHCGMNLEGGRKRFPW